MGYLLIYGFSSILPHDPRLAKTLNIAGITIVE